MSARGREFWIDRGGTFTDVVALRPDGTTQTHKVRSVDPGRPGDAALRGIREMMGVDAEAVLPVDQIRSVKMGTTVATNALLERNGEQTVFVTTRGFGDALRIGYQTRPDLFALDIELPDVLHGSVIEVDERVGADGAVVAPLDDGAARVALAEARNAGFDAVAIALMHGYRYPEHERRLASIAAELGFPQISVSHEVSPLMKLVSRGDTTVVDAYLSPVLRSYVASVAQELGDDRGGPPLLFMQSSGGLTDATRFRGKDALLSGPAGGVIGMVTTASAAGFDRLIGFDMGGTSTDVSHFAGALERTDETVLDGVRVRAPMMDIHTVAAGGGSILRFDGSRLRVGPASAGADPGPAAYGNGGPLTITDCQVLLGTLQPAHFPAVFGSTGREPLDVDPVRQAFGALAAEVGDATGRTVDPTELASGFLAIAVDNMANAIKKISVQRGHDVSTYTLVCFGGAGGQHACLVADRLGIEQILVHPHAGVLSAVGIGLAAVRHLGACSVERPLTESTLAGLRDDWARLEEQGRSGVHGGQTSTTSPADATVTHFRRVRVRDRGSDTAFTLDADDEAGITASFREMHRARFGFVDPDAHLVVESIQVETVVAAETAAMRPPSPDDSRDPVVGRAVVTLAGTARETPFVARDRLGSGATVTGPAVVVEPTGTTVVEPGWVAEVSPSFDLVLRRAMPRAETQSMTTDVDPVQLEIFNNLFMNIAEQMGVVLEQTAASVNIKERLDFSCAVFDPAGDLIANAPHMPVHLGSMSESIKSVIRTHPTMADGDVYVTNAPYNGGTHLPDITVVKPVFDPDDGRVIFYVAARGHHADIGGSVPGSAPAGSTSVAEEGILLDNVLLVSGGRLLDHELRRRLASGPYPARNPDQNIADLTAQVAACEKGTSELRRVIDHYGLAVVHAYMAHVKENAEAAVRRVIDALHDGAFTIHTDDGHQISVAITVDRSARSARIDFTGTSATHPGNFNAPTAIAHAAVLYVFRCLVADDIPLNVGCMVPLELVLPAESMINPSPPAAVVAGNVETSQLIVDALFGALGVMGAAQGTMNNFIWGNDEHQYYETICGGAGATSTADGCDAVHTHMTNSRLTDPEVLEWRHPVRLEEFSIRRGSGGPGTHRGGDGVIRRLRFLEEMEVNILSGRRSVPPLGMAGGRPGTVGENRVIRADGDVTVLGGVAEVDVEPGDVVEIATPGGGGFGPPSARRE